VEKFDIFPSSIYTPSYDQWFRSYDVSKSRVAAGICSGQIEMTQLIELFTTFPNVISGNFEYESRRELHKFSNECLNSRFQCRMKELRIFEFDSLFLDICFRLG
jgi:hypothetical protein